MENLNRTSFSQMCLSVIVWGGLWGIFEASFGYLLHLLPFNIGWLVWYSAACFFMYCVYKKTKRVESIIFIALLASSIKLLNLFMPVRIDRVINPAISIVFEAISMFVVVLIMKIFFFQNKNKILAKAFAVFSMNTLWRGFYALYLLFIVPDWMREISVISSSEALFEFFIVQNILSSLFIFSASFFIKYIFNLISLAEKKTEGLLSVLSFKLAAGLRIAVAICLISISIALGVFL